MSEFENTARNGNRKTMKSNNTASAQFGKSAGRFLLPIAFCGLLMSGCASGKPGTQTPPTATGDDVYTYQGVGNKTAKTATQNYNLSWSLTLSQSDSFFQYTGTYLNSVQNGTSEVEVGTVVSGNYVADSSYLTLTSAGQSSGAQGYALSIPGQAALLRPGDGTTPPVVTAAMNSCPVLTNSATYLFVALPGVFWDPSTSAAYGSLQASTDATGTNWSFSNQSQSLFAGSGSPSSYPASFTGTCGQGTSGYGIGVLPTITWPNSNPTISVSPGGFFTETATGQQTDVGGLGTDYAQQPFVGVAAPSSALDTTSLAAAKYLGFMYESLPITSSNQSLTTQLVSFGSAVAGSGTTMTGGVFPNDDPSQTPAANIAVNFGSQSATQNGLYTGVTVTIPDTTETHIGVNYCTNNGGISGTGTNGSQTCSFSAIAVAGNPNSKYAVFLIGQDPLTTAPFGLYLYQQ